MTIHIEDLTFNVIIGILDFEREKPQRVIVNVITEYEYNSQDFINYADIVLLIENELNQKHYQLLEDALLGLKSLIITTYPHIKTLSIKIAKPDILPHTSVALSHSWTF
jgi:dihydroneopterin aldolase